MCECMHIGTYMLHAHMKEKEKEEEEKEKEGEKERMYIQTQDWIIYHCFLFSFVFRFILFSDHFKSTGEICLRSTAAPCAHHQCMSSPNPEFKLFFRNYLLFVLCVDGVCVCVMVCVRRSEDNTESCFSFTFPWIPGIKLKSLSVYKPSLTRPCYTDLKLCLWNTAFHTVESDVCRENWLVEEESKHENHLHMQSAWAVTCYHYSTQLKTGQSTKWQTASMIPGTVAACQHNMCSASCSAPKWEACTVPVRLR